MVSCCEESAPCSRSQVPAVLIYVRRRWRSRVPAVLGCLFAQARLVRATGKVVVQQELAHCNIAAQSGTMESRDERLCDDMPRGQVTDCEVACAAS